MERCRTSACLWAAMAVANGLLVVLQGTGFHRHSAKVGRVLVG
ncbi:hypothetical protein [Nonomuraea jabiensis]|uniref:Uncharacterized protein n=1 Tax=Nonomuraea jabiensis TaxID=882448 RepID=A0A7W9G0Y6_9ACTN|nr:hypothetical protein [Nonomuraea jabiensis]MBB5775234.1 hypothetical protein [Nonomuraea jabiensis]